MSFLFQTLLGLSQVDADFVEASNLIATNLTITGQSNLNLLTVTGAAYFSNNVSITGTLQLAQTGTFNGGLIINNGLSVAGIYTVYPTYSTPLINSIISNPNYSRIIFAPGTYIQSQALFVARSNIILDGQNGANLYMYQGINNPNILIGDSSSASQTNQYYQIEVTGFSINGNRLQQTQEQMIGKTYITNDCIYITYCQDVLISGNSLTGAISGGLVVT